MDTIKYLHLDTSSTEPVWLVEKGSIVNRAEYYDEEERELTMYHEFPTSDIERERIHLRDRAYPLFDKKLNQILRHYHLQDDEYPQTAKEAIERIRQGRFVLPEKDEELRGYSLMDRIKWRDPNAKPDKEGAKLPKENLEKDYNHLMDSINVYTPKEGLEALRAFEAKSPV